MFRQTILVMHTFILNIYTVQFGLGSSFASSSPWSLAFWDTSTLLLPFNLSQVLYTKTVNQMAVSQESSYLIPLPISIELIPVSKSQIMLIRYNFKLPSAANTEKLLQHILFHYVWECSLGACALRGRQTLWIITRPRHCLLHVYQFHVKIISAGRRNRIMFKNYRIPSELSLLGIPVNIYHVYYLVLPTWRQRMYSNATSSSFHTN